MRPWQRQLIQLVVIGAALAGTAAAYWWWATRPYASHSGAETSWRVGSDRRTLTVVVVMDDNTPVENAIVRAFNTDSNVPADGTTLADGRAYVRIGSGRLKRLTLNGVDLFERDGWTAPSTDDGLVVMVRVLDRDTMRLDATEQDLDQIAAEERLRLDQLEATLRDPGGEWRMAWRMLANLDEAGWQRIERNLFDLSPETDHLRAMTVSIDPASRMSSRLDEHYRARLAERAADETWAMTWARALLADPATAAAMGKPWIGHYADPIDARLDVAFARAAYRKRFGYTWTGDPDEQHAALARWRAYLATVDASGGGEPIDPVVSRSRPSIEPPHLGEFDRPGFPGLPRLDEDGRPVQLPIETPRGLVPPESLPADPLR